MNANELADELKEISLIADNHTKIVLGIAETMLRQQQAEIEALKAKIKWYDDTFRLPTETHPAKTLTDTEIHYELDRWERHNNYKHGADVHQNLMDFARAILKKAREK
jgi:hypothetical protein